jgi:MFS family permease
LQNQGGSKARKGRIFYGWWIVATCFVVNFLVFGISVNTVTVYVKPLEADLGWSRGQIGLSMTLGALAMGAAAPFTGKLIDLAGARLAMAAGATIVGVGSILLSGTQSLAFFYTVYVLSGVGQAAATVIPISLVISNWFTAQRAKALGVAMTGTGLGAMVMVPVTNWIVSTWGWRTSFWVMGCLILSMVPLTLLFIRTRPADMGLLPDGDLDSEDALPATEGLGVLEAIRTPAFWLIGCMMLLAGLVAMGVGLHLMAYLTDIGHPEATAALIISIISGLTVAGKITLGSVADRWGVRPVVALAFALIAAGIAILMGARDLPIAFAFALVYGFAIGAPLVLNPALTAECLGLRSFGAVFGILTLLNTAGVAIGAYLSGVIYDSVGSYIPAFALYVVLSALAALCGMLARRAYST